MNTLFLVLLSGVVAVTVSQEIPPVNLAVGVEAVKEGEVKEYVKDPHANKPNNYYEPREYKPRHYPVYNDRKQGFCNDIEKDVRFLTFKVAKLLEQISSLPYEVLFKLESKQKMLRLPFPFYPEPRQSQDWRSLRKYY